MIKLMLKLIAIVGSLVLFPGCILMCDFAEGFNAVPYDGLYTTSYMSTKDEAGNFHYWREQFPIGFWGDLNIKFWNAYGDYHKTKTWKRFQEWKALPKEQRYEEIPFEEWPYRRKRR